MNLKKTNAFLLNNLRVVFFSIIIGLFACAISIFAFSSPGSNQPPNGTPTFWLLNGTSMYYSNGNVGIGTNNPAASLQIVSTAPSLDLSLPVGTWGGTSSITLHGVFPTSDPTNYSVGIISVGMTTTSWANSYIDFQGRLGNGSLASVMRILSGNVGIGTTNPSTTLQVNGTVTASGFAGPGSVPGYAVMAFYTSTCPTGWVLADGTNSTPDLRGMFIRGAGANGTRATANGTYYTGTYGGYQNDQMQGFYNSLDGAPDYQVSPGGGSSNRLAVSNGANSGAGWNKPVSDGTNGALRMGAETRPANYSLTYCMKSP